MKPALRIIVIIIFAALFPYCSQRDNSVELYHQIYNQGREYNDVNTIIYALNRIVQQCENRENCQPDLDELINLYYSKGNFKGSYQLLKKYGFTDREMEKKQAFSALSFGLRDEALQILEPWVYADTTNNIEARYYLSILLHEDKADRIAFDLLNDIVNNEKSLSTPFKFQEGDYMQMVSAYSAAHYQAAIFYLDRKKIKSATYHFEEAIAKQPNFDIAIYRLNALKENIAETQID